MHGPIRDRVEELLGSQAPAGLTEHLGSCPECANELGAMKEQAALLKTLRAPANMELAPGFYARVMQRIEEEGVSSVWTVFTDGPFGKWLAYASLAIALILGTWIVGLEREDGHLGSTEPVIAEHVTGDVPVTGDADHQRDAVLVNLASYSQDEN